MSDQNHQARQENRSFSDPSVTKGERLMAALNLIISERGGSFGATVMRNQSDGQLIEIGNERPNGSNEINQLLAEGFEPIGVFVIIKVDETSFKLLVLTAKSVSEEDEPAIKQLIFNRAGALFPDLRFERIASA
jgi:hypothetical protein